MPSDLDPNHPTREAPRDREDSPASDHSFSDSDSESQSQAVPQWVKQALANSQSDTRVQPWKNIFKSDKVLEHMDNTMEDGEDLVVVPGPKLPSAGEATIFEQQSLAG